MIAEEQKSFTARYGHQPGGGRPVDIIDWQAPGRAGVWRDRLSICEDHPGVLHLVARAGAHLWARSAVSRVCSDACTEKPLGVFLIVVVDKMIYAAKIGDAEYFDYQYQILDGERR